MIQIQKIASGDDRKHSYGCLMLKVDMDNWKQILSTIDKQDIYDQEQGYGLQQNPHITILYGLHDDQIDQDKLQQKIRQSVQKPIKLTLKQINLFSNKQNPYDVVKYEVESEDLVSLNKIFKKFKNTNSYPVYKAHMTIAYVKSGKGKKYEKEITPINLTGTQIEYSMANEQRKYFKMPTKKKATSNWYSRARI